VLAGILDGRHRLQLRHQGRACRPGKWRGAGHRTRRSTKCAPAGPSRGGTDHLFHQVDLNALVLLCRVHDHQGAEILPERPAWSSRTPGVAQRPSAGSEGRAAGQSTWPSSLDGVHSDSVSTALSAPSMGPNCARSLTRPLWPPRPDSAHQTATRMPAPGSPPAEAARSRRLRC